MRYVLATKLIARNHCDKLYMDANTVITKEKSVKTEPR
jgi:hypothetical protein